MLKTYSLFLNFDLFTREFYKVIMENYYYHFSGIKGWELKGTRMALYFLLESHLGNCCEKQIVLKQIVFKRKAFRLCVN